MAEKMEAIATRVTRLNQLILGKSNYKLPTKHLVHRDGLLDVLFALYEECSADHFKKDKHIAGFADKFKAIMLELKSLRVSLKDFEVKKIIGRGHFGEVQVVREKATGDVYAMKVLRKQETLSQQNMAFYEEERDIMAKSSSPWLTKLQYAFQDTQNLYLIMEFHPGGDMLSLLEKYDNVLPEDMCQFYLAELVLAIHSLHSIGYVHRDIKPDNILVDRTGHIKLADFGSSSKLNSKKEVTSSMPVGTPDYVAPEVLTAMNSRPSTCKSYGVECDWWSLGIVSYEMTFGATPFTDDKVLNTYNNIMNFKKSLKFPPEASEVSGMLIDLIKNLLKGAESRYGYDQLVVHPLFTDIDWNNIRHTAPPFVPTVSGVDDTSNFDEFEPENRLYVNDLKTKKDFSGKNLPFVGFTYTSTFETRVERYSSADDSLIRSPTSSLTEVDASSKKREFASMQKKLDELSVLEKSLKKELAKWKNTAHSKDGAIECIKTEKAVLESLVLELQAEVKQVKQLLGYEREHRVITEKKASHLVKCMKMRQKQDYLRLKSKSQEFHQGETEKVNLEEQLDTAFEKIDDFIKEKADLLEELHETKHLLLECQKKLQDKELDLLSGQNSSSHSSDSCVSSNPEGQVSTSTLVKKLENKNIQLEQELDVALNVRKKLEAEMKELRSVVLLLEKKSEQSKKRTADTTPIRDKKVLKSIENSQLNDELVSKCNTINEMEEKLRSERENSTKLKQKIESLESELKGFIDSKGQMDTKVKQLEEKILSLEKQSNDKRNSRKSRSPEKSIMWEKKVQSRNEMQERILLSSDLKQENDFLKSRIDVLNLEISKLKDDFKSTEEIKKQLKTKEAELSDAKLDLRVSTRKEQQTESLASSLRERNKELREKLKNSEEMVATKTKAEEDLSEKVKILESEITRLKDEINQNEKTYQIQIAKLEERIKAMSDTCESSKDMNHKYAKTQGQYEELSRRNADLAKECEEKDKRIIDLSQENKILKNDLATKQNECNKFKQVNGVLKSTCVELEEDMKDFEIIVEAREKAIADLSEDNEKLQQKLNKLEEELKDTGSSARNEEREKEELLKHINELTAEMENQAYLHETEIQNLQDDLSHLNKVVNEMEEQAAHWQKELSMQDKSTKTSSERILTLESQLCEIKEEAARHITQISSLKSSNLKLTQALDDALANQEDAQKNIDELYNELESERAKQAHEKVKMQETLAQQTKLIDFLQSKTETMEKKKRPNLSRLFGKKENIPVSAPPRDVEKLLETERSRCRRLQDQLSQARAEKMALQREISQLSKPASANTEIPVSPMSRAMHNAITASPVKKPDMDSPVLSSKDRLAKILKPPGMKHKIPHRFSEVMCMRSSKCCACLDSIHFGRPVVKCQECSVTCHPKCSTSLPSTCGLPEGFMQHFRSAVQDYTSEDSSQDGDSRSEGWIKLPKSNKQGWERRYLRLIDDHVLCVFEDAEERDSKKALSVFDFGSGDVKITVTSAVSATELPYAATSDLPYVLKVETFPQTTCWPQRSLFIMTSNFNDKQKWVSILEHLAEKNIVEEEVQKNKLVGQSIWSLKSEKLVDPLCSIVLDENIILLGAMEGLFVLKIVNKLTCSLQEKLEGFSCVYQMVCLPKIGILMLIHGEERKLSFADLNTFEDKVYGSPSVTIELYSVADVKSCHLFAVDENSNTDTPYTCIATSDYVILCQWDSTSRNFYTKKVIQANEPCSCILFTHISVVFGTDVFYELSLSSYSTKKFLDGSDASLAGLVYGASQFDSFPVAIFQISENKQTPEYLLCFHELGVFVNIQGQRTRADDMKWSRLPLAFAYRLPYLFITHFTSLEVITIPPPNIPDPGLRACMFVQNPQYMGLAHTDHSILVSSTHNAVLDLFLVDGSSIGNSDFPLQSTDDGTSTAYTGSISSCKSSAIESDDVDLDFSFSTSVDNIIDELDRSSVFSKNSTESTSSQS